MIIRARNKHRAASYIRGGINWGRTWSEPQNVDDINVRDACRILMDDHLDIEYLNDDESFVKIEKLTGEAKDEVIAFAKEHLVKHYVPVYGHGDDPDPKTVAQTSPNPDDSTGDPDGADASSVQETGDQSSTDNADAASATDEQADQATADAAVKADLRLDLNTATREQLESIDGLGKASIGAIFEQRPWAAVKDLARLRGITDEKAAAFETVLKV